ncbi:uncharacterized protein LOC128234520 [Mya arenaria]|uniref:uncharacterized protein LOC128234520 n=1 Tax=Mya arenaria TaxID=6604 RepID=UPI0022E578DE|nr:uncharacterized protein LOC128234520 [Mya arenaria]
MSVCLLMFGLSAVLATAPYYEYPASVGGGCFFGITGLVYSVVAVIFIREASKPLENGRESVCFRRITWAGTQWMLFWINVIGFLLSLVFSGVFPISTCLQQIADMSQTPLTTCRPNPTANLILALIVLLLSVALIVLQVVFSVKRGSKVVRRVRKNNSDEENGGNGALNRAIQTKNLVMKYIQTPASRTRRKP